jgi:tetratricopeptide (TPR) repeat protein
MPRGFAMASHDATRLPPVTPEHRRAAAGMYERANQVITTGNYDYGIQLLLNCCKLDPAILQYRQALRRTEKAKYKNNLRGSVLAGLRSWPTRARMKAAKRIRDYIKVLEHGEQVLARNPWDTGTQLDMAEAAHTLGLLDLAIWILEQARQKNPRDLAVNRALARRYEERGNFAQAIALWELIRRAAPTDLEAQDKAKNLAASETIARGHYEEVVANPPKHDDEEEAAEQASNGPPDTDTAPRTDPTAPATPAVPERTGGETGRLRARIEADPTNPHGYLHLAMVFRRAGQLDQARAVLEQGLGPTGNEFELTIELADLAIEPFRANLAITEDKLRSHPDDEELRKIRIRLLKEINSREMDLFRRKADRYPNELGHRFELGLRLLRAGQTDEAIRELQAARADARSRWRALLYLGHCFKLRKNWRLAKRNFEDALQELPANEIAARKDILFELAQGAADANEWSDAIDMGHELANLDFAYKDIGRLLDEWTARQVASDK